MMLELTEVEAGQGTPNLDAQDREWLMHFGNLAKYRPGVLGKRMFPTKPKG